MDQEVIQQRSAGCTTRIRRLYNKDQEVMFSDAIIEPLQKTFAYKGCKISAQKKFFVFANFALPAGFFDVGATIRVFIMEKIMLDTG